MFKLVISDDEGKTTVVPLIRDEITIGRKEGNTIRLTDRNVSRFHARVIRDNDGFIIEDLGSLCGTHVNAKVLKSESAPITTGDNMSIGDYSLSIRSDVAADVPMGKQMDPGDQTGIGKVTPHARLVMLVGPLPGREQDLTAELYVVGRSEEANFRIDHPSISRAHARIDLESGKWTISDLDSINGIFINGFKKDDYVLKAGDIIRLGTVELRFVAPGEPYEFNPPSEEERYTLEPSGGKKLKPLLLIACAILVVVAGVMISISMWREAERAKAAATVVEETQTYDSLLEEGKDKMQSEEWSEAARLFAMASHKKGDATEAKDLKNLSIQEADAQSAFNAGLAAQENKSWREAIDHFQKIPRNSHYYDAEQIKELAEKLCDESLVRASFVMKTATKADLDAEIREIFSIPMAPARCRGPKAGIIAELERIAREAVKDGGMLEGLNDEMMQKPVRAKKHPGAGRGRKKGDQEGGGNPSSGGKGKIKNPYKDKIMNPYDE